MTFLSAKQLVFGALAAMAVGCATPPRPWTRPEGPYGEALVEATRGTVLTHGIDNELILYATEESAAFRRARAEHLAEMFHLKPEAAELRAPELTAPVEGLAYFVAVHANDRTQNDLERPGSHWSVVLEAGGQVLSPTSLVRIDRATPELKPLYPYTDRHFVPYRVVFPAPPPGVARALVVSGVAGQARLEFPASRE